jgi:TolB-like protein/tetratricopeptide (TPR) repeat protein
MPLSDPFARLTAALGRRYAFERELGRGGMGTVYLALDRKHSRRVAIKVLPSDLASALGPERFLREIEIAARLSHPHILPLHDSGQGAGMLYYVMPWIEGESLRARLAQGPLPPQDALKIAREIADALGYAHQLGVIHRDVKPENILLAGYPPEEGSTHDWHALLADFGVAKALAGSVGWQPDRLTDSGLPLGTVAYASPEQAAGSKELDQRSDLYSLGCVLYEMLVGDEPGRVTVSDLLARRFTEPLPRVGQLRPELPRWLDNPLARAVATNPSDRYASAGEFRRALNGPVVGDGEAEPSPGRRARRPHRLRWVAVAAAALTLVASGIAFLPRRSITADPKRVLVAGFQNRTGDSALNVIGDIAGDYIARGLAATRLMHDVFDARAMSLESGTQIQPGAAAGREMARRVGAGTVLSGTYYLEDDSLHIEAQLVEALTGRMILSLEPAVGSVREKTHVVETLRQRVMAGFATVAGPGFETWTAASVPPTYDAYQEMLAGGAATWQHDFAGAAMHYRRAAALDSSFTGAQTAAALVLQFRGDCRAVDSIARRLEPRENLLPPADRGQLDYATATCHRDPDGALAASRAVLAVVPRSLEFTVLAAVTAVEALRPREALEVLRRVEPARLGLKGHPYEVYMDWLAMTYHMLGDYQRELETARAAGRATAHLSDDEAAALAGLGRTQEAERMAVGFLPDHYSGDEVWAPEMAECVALELRAHGQPEAARRVLDRVVAWFRSGGPAARSTDDSFPCLWHHFNAFYYAGQWDEARSGYVRALGEDSGSVKAHAALGALAARRGDRAEVTRMEAWLRTDPDNAHMTYAQARIAAILGDRQKAVALLRHAFELGLNGRMFVHVDPDFEALRDYPPYRELIRLKE